VFGYFTAMFAELVERKFLRCLHFIFLRDVIAVFANRTNETYFNSVFAFLSHGSNYTLLNAGLEELY
jgi:hypothetical protein